MLERPWSSVDETLMGTYFLAPVLSLWLQELTPLTRSWASLRMSRSGHGEPDPLELVRKFCKFRKWLNIVMWYKRVGINQKWIIHPFIHLRVFTRHQNILSSEVTNGVGRHAMSFRCEDCILINKWWEGWAPVTKRDKDRWCDVDWCKGGGSWVESN